jgi:hypothetical protein
MAIELLIFASLPSGRHLSFPLFLPHLLQIGYRRATGFLVVLCIDGVRNVAFRLSNLLRVFLLWQLSGGTTNILQDIVGMERLNITNFTLGFQSVTASGTCTGVHESVLLLLLMKLLFSGSTITASLCIHM